MRTLNLMGRSIIFIAILCILNSADAQHRGDNMAFQGLAVPNGNGVKALAMGGAYTSISGDVNSLFWNPAGLAGIEGLQFSFGVNSYQKMWRENQVYRPNRQFVTMSFILDGLYVPDPAYNGAYDYEVFRNDTNYVVNEPLLGLDYYSKEAADWQKDVNDFDLDHVVIGVPFKLAGKKFVISAAYNKRYQILDYDRNHTYLVPHLGYTYYQGIVDRISDPADSIRVYWSDYERERTGNIWNVNTALAVELSEHLKLGLGINGSLGETNDSQELNRVAYFDLVDANKFRFSYDTLDVQTTGTSKFSAISFNIGAIIDFENISLGLKIVPSYKIKRDWDYTTTDTSNYSSVTPSGQDAMKVPISYAVGISFNPVKQFRIAFDLENTKYSQSDFTLANQDTTHRDWVDQTIIGVGIEYKPWDWLSLLGGYRSVPETFVPDGTAFRDRGPTAESFTFGVSLKALFGYFDVAYEIRSMKYYDSYFSNTNYALETFNNLSVGYTITF